MTNQGPTSWQLEPDTTPVHDRSRIRQHGLTTTNKEKTMWYLESYDNQTDLIADSYLLTAITGDEIRELIDVDESELPLEMGPYPVALADVPKFAMYIEGDFRVSSDNEYFIGLFTD
ncbi:DUF7683 domain-containing protein [Rhodococcoides fascians]|uniref:DUF7683 domain-containing protein n=1 Tax=Rhodococcoides fascians TaxID=1828 RepID=UPI0024BAAD50|nr:hypothetical protein [Rhodococcus fascians]MDJ0471715.1 hypothetical protein [Rhodococcus fascians]